MVLTGGRTDSERNFENIQKNNKPHIFTTPRPLGSGVVKIWGLLFFFKKYKIGNNDFITILGSENLNSVMFTTNYCSNPTVNVPVGSITHLESPWTLNITPILSTVSRDLILGLKNQNYHNPDVFYSWIPPRSSSDRIRIHWIMIYMFEIHQFFDETYPSYVPFIPYYHTW